MITQLELKQMLDRLLPARWCAWDWRRLANGRVVRFIDWREAVRHA